MTMQEVTNNPMPNNEIIELAKHAKEWDVETIVDSIGSAGMEFMADRGHGSVGRYKAYKEVMAAELTKRISNSK